MKRLAIASLALLATTTLFAATSIEELAVEKCGECHVMGVVSKEKIKNMKAPPYWSIARKLRENFDRTDYMANFVVDFTFNPSQEKMLYPPETIKMFGLMPSQKGKVTEEEIRQIVEYILGNHLPEASGEK